MPIERPDLIERVTLGERPTPMLRARSAPAGHELWLKNDALLPTCSLKDRSIPLTVIKALELGRDTVGIVSSGNAAASLSAYAARAGLRAVVFVGGGPSPSKLYKCMIYKPVAVEVLADYSQADAMFQKARDEFGIFDCDGLVNPYRIEGKKSFAYEMARDLGWRSPATVLMPTAYGNGLVAAWKGFQEMHRLGFVDTLPAMVAVQPEEVSPIADAFRLGLDHVPPKVGGRTIAQAVSVANPDIGGSRTLAVALQSHGSVIAVSEDEIRGAVAVLGEREGIAIEPGGALAYAGALKLIRENSPLSGGVVVACVTGHGLNDPEVCSQGLPMPIRVEAVYAEVAEALSKALSSA
jgi:threonine synthase